MIPCTIALPSFLRSSFLASYDLVMLAACYAYYYGPYDSLASFAGFAILANKAGKLPKGSSFLASRDAVVPTIISRKLISYDNSTSYYKGIYLYK